MEITIQIEKKKENSDPTFKDLKLSHKECKGGAIETRRNGKTIDSDLIILCRRCHAECLVPKDEESNAKSEMVKTASDGQERQITVEKEGNKDYNVSLVIKDPSSEEKAVVPDSQTLNIDLLDE